MSVDAISVIVPDVPEAARFLSGAFGWELGDVFDNFAELDTGKLKLWLSGNAAVETGAVDGLTLHHIVDDVDAVVEVAKSHGAELVFGPVDTDYGMRSAVFKGPGMLLVDVCTYDAPAASDT
ncbi:VOC family protein [Kribbella sp. HUAS MG21]|jgi:catechol 2,3-dioxygenase-like lactoylglutathione lyase family enzyme|uniref:VOC family protein n=1 Tax=Kribbella sp. HUAS MG21 TaxID=3160966 RepID=A0AAU7TDX7_9ACTN